MAQNHRAGGRFAIAPDVFRRVVASPWAWAGAIMLLAVLAVLPGAARALRNKTGDFTHFWRAAAAMLNGDDIYAADEGRYVYPPLLAFMLQPLAMLPERVAAIIWMIVSTALLVTALLILSSELAVRWKLQNTSLAALRISAIALALNFDKIRSLLSLGQTDALLLAAFVCIFICADCKPLLAGLAVGASANLKYLSLIFVPYFAITGRYRAAGASVVFFFAFLLLPAVRVGLSQDVDYLATALGGVAKMVGARSTSTSADIFDVTWNRSISITSTMFRFSRASGFPDWLAIALIFILFSAVVAALVAICRRQSVAIFAPRAGVESNPVVTLEWAALIVLALAFSPQTTLRHTALIILVYAIAVALAFTVRARKAQLLLICAIALLVGALNLPPYGIGIDEAVWTWREIGGPSWCACLFLLALGWIGSKTLSVRTKE